MNLNEQTNGIFEDLKLLYDDVIVLASNPMNAAECVQGKQANLIYMLGRCLGNTCRNMTANISEQEKEEALEDIFRIFRDAIQEAYIKGADHDKSF